MLKLNCLLSILCIHYNTIFVTASPNKIDPSILKKLNKGETVNVLVTFINGVKSTLEKAKLQKSRGGDRGADIKKLVDALKKNA